MNISIAMATYNGAEHLQAQLDSFVSQPRLPEELIVTDDCSTDNTVQILENFAKIAPFKVIIHRNDRNYGYCGNFNQALLRTTGDLVFLSDQDDVWFSEKIERMAAVAGEDTQALIVMNDAALTYADLVDTGLTKLGQIRSAGFKESRFVMGCCAAVKRDLLDLCLPIPEEFPAHDDCLVRIAYGMGRRRIVPEVLQYYRRHGKNESQWIVNRTTRVTRWHVRAEHWKGRVKRLIGRGSGTSTPCRSVGASQLLVRRCAEAALGRAPEPYATDLRRYLDRLDQQARAQAQRADIRQQQLPARLGSVLSFWRVGGYAGFSGVKSAVRDLVGR